MSEKSGPLSNGLIEMHVQRHDAHELGHLTPEGREHAKQIADEKVEKYLDNNPNTHFMVVASDQVFDDREPGLGGRRAHETAAIIIDSIQRHLAERGLPAEQLFGHEDIDPVTQSRTLREADIFSNDFMSHIREQYPEDNPWSVYYQDIEADQRQRMQAESPADLALRMDYMIKTAEMVGASLHKVPGKEHSPLVVWIVGHGGGLDAYLHHYGHVPLDQLGFDLSGGFSIQASEDGEKIVANVKGQQYTLDRSPDMLLPK